MPSWGRTSIWLAMFGQIRSWLLVIVITPLLFGSIGCVRAMGNPAQRVGKSDGEVQIKLREGDRFEGELRAGRREGRGKYYWSNGDTYDGEWIDDRMSGQGTLIFANGEKYEGEFLDGHRNGYGTYTWPNGKEAKGFWDNDILVKQ